MDVIVFPIACYFQIAAIACFFKLVRTHSVELSYLHELRGVASIHQKIGGDGWGWGGEAPASRCPFHYLKMYLTDLIKKIFSEMLELPRYLHHS